MKDSLISKILILVLIILGMILGFALNKGIAQEERVSEAKIETVIRQTVLERARQHPDEFQRVIIIFRKKPDDYKQFIQSLEGRIIHDFNIIEGVAVSLPGRLIERIKGLKNLVSIQEDREVHAFLTESVPLIKADDVWGLGYDGSGKTVCVIDTGIDYNHPALGGGFGPGYKVVDGYDFVNNDSDPMDDNGHGTHCAGIIASEDPIYKGVAPGANLMAVKVLDAAGYGYESDVIAGIDWCSAKNVDVISISLGGGLFSSYCDGEADAQAVNNAVNAGAVVVIASGNDGSTTKISAPACASKATSVGAVYDANVGAKTWCFNPPSCTQTCTDNPTYADKIVCFTNRNKILDLLAPGAIITSIKLGGGFTNMSGTSMAAPHVSGSTALLRQRNPNLIPDEVEDILKATGVNIVDSKTGLTFPRVDASAAVQLSNKPKIKTIKVYDVTGLNTHTDISNLVKSGLDEVFKLEPGKTYRAEIYVKNIGVDTWFLGLADSAYHEGLNSDWTISTNDIWYTIGKTNHTGGSWSGGKVNWNTSQGGEIASTQTAVFKYVFSVPSNQTETAYDIHAYFKTGTYFDEDYSKYSFLPSICYVLANKGTPDSNNEQPFINELKNIGYCVECNTARCHYDADDIINKSANFSGYKFWAHSFLSYYYNANDALKNARTYYVDERGNNELILDQDVAVLGAFDYASLSPKVGYSSSNAVVVNVNSVLPGSDYIIGATPQIYKLSGTQWVATKGNLNILNPNITTYLDDGAGGNNKYRIHGAYTSAKGKMGFFGIDGNAILTTSADNEDNGREILTYLTDWLIPVAVPILSVSVSPNTWPIGNIGQGQTTQSTTDDDITVTNTGSVNETFTLNITLDGSSWWPALRAGNETYVMWGLFCGASDTPGTNLFKGEDIILSGSPSAATECQFPNTECQFGDPSLSADGVGIVQGGSRDLWLQFQAPTSTLDTSEQKIYVTVGAEQTQ